MIKFLLANPKILSLLGLIGVGLILAVVVTLTKNKTEGPTVDNTVPSQIATPSEETVDMREIDPFADEDNDGLTTQQENLFGTNPAISDTDNDGTSDGNEIRSGTDPLRAGEASLSENEKFSKNLTMQFYDWRQKNQSVNGFSIQKEDVDLFLKEKGIVFQRKTLSAQQAGVILINRTPKENELQQFYENRYTTPNRLPEQLSSFLLDSLEVLTDTSVDALPYEMLNMEERSGVTISNLITALDDAQKALTGIKAYKTDLAESVADDIAAMQQLRDLLSEIKENIDEDPVVVARNNEWAVKLLHESNIYNYIYPIIIEIRSPDMADFIEESPEVPIDE